MKLQELIQNIPVKAIIGNKDTDIIEINIDSRIVDDGHLFIAMRGTQTDGHSFIDKALSKGARAICCETMPEDAPEYPDVAFILVDSTEEIAGKIATRFYGDPTKKLKLVGVTGTNGKTTIATLLYQMFRNMGHKVGLLSTVCNYINDEAVPATHTTPDPITLNRLLGEMANKGCEYAFMEVSSHSVAQHRIAGLEFAGGIFTNLTRDHLDYHKTVENYLQAKKSFFDNLPKGSFVVTNADDKNGKVMVQNTLATVKEYSLRTLCDFKGRILEDHFDGMLIDFNGMETAVQFVGRFNASNLLAVFSTAVMLGKAPEETLRIMSTLKPVSGRFETIRSPKGYTAIVDYAHTPDAMENVLKTVRGFAEKRIITLFGCGGDRDKTKRPIMGKMSVDMSDFVIITSDNSRTENTEDIIKDIVAGIDGKTNFEVVPDRKEAIKRAIDIAEEGDIVLLLGKGHEEYEIGINGKVPFSEREIVKEYINAK